MDKEMRKLIKALEEHGFTVEISRNGHIKVYRDGKLATVLAETPGDWRSVRNSLRYLKPYGFRWWGSPRAGSNA